jgi:hypothetical protein
MLIKENIALSDNGFVFNPSTGDSFTMNNTGREVLLHVKEGKDISAITDIMYEKYDIDRLILERFISDFINDLNAYNLLEEVK